jgi:hypothetical protein
MKWKKMSKEQVVFGLMLVGNLLFFAAYLLGMFWKKSGG